MYTCTVYSRRCKFREIHNYLTGEADNWAKEYATLELVLTHHASLLTLLARTLCYNTVYKFYPLKTTQIFIDNAKYSSLLCNRL